MAGCSKKSAAAFPASLGLQIDMFLVTENPINLTQASNIQTSRKNTQSLWQQDTVDMVTEVHGRSFMQHALPHAFLVAPKQSKM
jgi:hypothetical protein